MDESPSMALYFIIFPLILFPTGNAQLTPTSLNNSVKSGGLQSQAYICGFCDAVRPDGYFCCDNCVQPGSIPPDSEVLNSGCVPYAHAPNFECVALIGQCVRSFIVTVNRFTDQYGDHWYSQNRNAYYGTSYIFENVLGLGSQVSGSGLVPLDEYTKTLANGAIRHYYSVNPADVPSGYTFSRTVIYIYTQSDPGNNYEIHRYYNAPDLVALLTMNTSDTGGGPYWTEQSSPGYMLTQNPGCL